MNHLQIRALQSKDIISFRCQGCGQCCRHVGGNIMLESLDAYRLANFLNQQGGRPIMMDDIFYQYCQPSLLTELNYPVYLLQTYDDDDCCIFFKEGSCKIYPVRPRTCRLYPFTVAPGGRGKDFEYYLCTDRPHHLTGDRISVNEWLYQHFFKEEREFVKLEFQYAAQIGSLIRELSPDDRKSSISLLLFFRYYNFNLEEPFLPQYVQNQKELLKGLKHF